MYHSPTMSDPLQPTSIERKPNSGIALYSIQGIVMGTIFGSLAAGVVMLYLNYSALGRANLARMVATWGSALFITIILIASFAPGTTGYAFLFMVIQAGIAYFLADRLQGQAIAYHQQHSGSMHSNVRAVGVGFLTGIGLFFALATATAVWMAISGDMPPVLPDVNQATGV